VPHKESKDKTSRSLSSIPMNFSRRKTSRRKLREARERERWEGVLKGIEEKVNQEYGFQNCPQHEPTQTWKPMGEDEKVDFEERMTRHGYHSIGLGEWCFPLSILKPVAGAQGPDRNRDNELSPGKRWQVVEVRKQGVYSLNPYPGARETKSSD
jgi:hypothetical protein